MRIAQMSVVLLLTGPSMPTMAAGASDVIGAGHALFIEQTVDLQGILCKARAPDTAEQWAGALARWKGANQASLQQLKEIANGLTGLVPGQAPQPANAEQQAKRAVVQNFHILAALQTAYALAEKNDAKAREMCANWVDRLAEGAALEMSLPQAVAAARKLRGAAQ